MENQKQEIISISFNQDQSYFAIGTQKGFKIFKLGLEISQELSRQFGAGIGMIEMIHKTNIFALVGGGKTPRYPKNKLMIWDDAQMKCIVETSCKSDVKAVRLKTDKCVIVLETKIFVFNLADFRLLDCLETCPNPKGLCTVSMMKEEFLMAFPSQKIGIIEIMSESQTERKKLQAHKSNVCALELCPNGYKLATASQKGTIIRIFSVSKGECIQQLRRGSEYATIYSIAYDIKSQWLGCSSDSGTIHIFALKPTDEEANDKSKEVKNKKSKLSILSKLSSYFDSEWSFSQFRTSEKKTKVGFLPLENTLAFISSTGLVNIIRFDPEKGGECVKIAEYNIGKNNSD